MQNVSFEPVSAQDDQCRYHGFAFIILRDLDIVEKLINDWPWDPETPKAMITKDGSSRAAEIADASRCGFRALKL